MPYLPCLNTSTLRPASLFDKIDAAAQAGFKAIEPWNGEIDDFIAGGGTFQQVKDRIDGHGLKVVSCIAIMGFVGNDETGRDRLRACHN
jgi:2-keto-myo-inositol isomerase